jgi:hypothetical protein
LLLIFLLLSELTVYNIASYNPSVPDLGKWESLNGETVTLNGNITILGFSGSDILKIEEIYLI